MNQISILCRSIPLIAVLISCAGSATPEHTTSEAQEPPPPAAPAVATGRVFLSAIAVRDESATAFFGRLAPGKHAPSTLSIAFHDDAGAVLETVSKLDVQVSSTGFVYAAPGTALSKSQQQNIKNAVSAKATTGSDDVEPVYLGQAEGTISQFREGYREPQGLGVDGGGCPHCLSYFLCCCMAPSYDMIVNQAMLGCSKIECNSPCQQIKTLEPVPW